MRALQPLPMWPRSPRFEPFPRRKKAGSHGAVAWRSTVASPRGGALAALQIPGSEPDGGASAGAREARERESEGTSDTGATGARRAVPLPRITSVGLFTQIYAHPRRAGSPLGYVRRGTSVPLRDSVPIPGGSCVGRWYAALPRGYICNDNTSILETEQRVLSEGGERLVRALTSASPHEGAFPYGYALSLGAPMYGKIPVAAEQAEAEATLRSPRGYRACGREVTMVSQMHRCRARRAARIRSHGSSPTAARHRSLCAGGTGSWCARWRRAGR